MTSSSKEDVQGDGVGGWGDKGEKQRGHQSRSDRQRQERMLRTSETAMGTKRLGKMALLGEGAVIGVPDPRSGQRQGPKGNGV